MIKQSGIITILMYRHAEAGFVHSHLEPLLEVIQVQTDAQQM